MYLRTILFSSRILQQVSKTRVLSKKAIAKPVRPDIPVYIENTYQYKTGRKIAIENLQNLFGITTFDAYNIAVKNRILWKASTDLMRKNYQKYREHDVTDEILLKYPTLMAEFDLTQKISLLKCLRQDIKDIVVLVLLPLQDLIQFVGTEKRYTAKKSKINVMSKLLQISKLEVCNHLVKKKFLRVMQNDRIESKIRVLLSYNLTSEEICKDFWVLNYSEELIRNRLNLAKEHKVDKLKTWMVRATPEIFQHYIQRRSDNKSILGDNSLAEYLSERLECSIDVANYLIHKQPVLKNKSLKKLKELIDFLFAEGFKSYHICRIPKILVHSVETTKKRLKQLEDKNIKIDSLHILTKSKKQFQQYYEMLLKNKLKNEI